MKQGYLSQYFEGVALKRLSAVEADVIRSNQHEFNGVEGLRDILGEPDGKVRFSAKFLYLTDLDDEPVVEDGFLTWYDARQRARLERHVMRWEYRLYFPTNLVSQCASAGDLLVIARLANDSLLAIVAENGTTIERQIMWLFGFSELAHPGFSIKSELETEQDRIGFAARVILEQIGVEAEEEAPNYLDQMLDKFNGSFPKTIEFSSYARSTVRDLSSKDDPDVALFVWMEREEILFRTLEKYLLGEKLRSLTQAGIEDTEPFIKLVQSALQRRKSRAGSALENHLEQVFSDHGVTYTRTGVTENNLKPDFIFPGISHYHDSEFSHARLTMLASKSTCKDRWRQILNEAARIPNKHLLTLEPSISENQTNEMKSEQVQLVIPQGLHSSYTMAQQTWLMNIAGFIDLTRHRQTV
ncbi:restriction endonuclease [Erwinia sp. OLTSP20]|uniref:type II restriction endonuclease n=1 Tax=unclassified Erwinia TaxID=2622719 RepID=UPI000C1A2A86|nr:MULTISPECIES: type II restriction endonuclease [unclassified Erwinia]PIJ52124.1 restriction endonuclease [Erwinia sp. OAMSP11]PIJ73144.1 restriction endonuclease [Erwinia sp. OLSSP12]PIJ84653.1 restriction endonuclease [Erwinia sp. OLCASP19]PIJ87300.1 restriction endonuclease [Erwinia sp. OLMTSP26]PIJ87545.1 restriction endonuclease [Erwinia sp. OLMDSP33]